MDEEVTGTAIELRSMLLRHINVYAPKPIMQIAAMGCDKPFHRGLIDVQLQAANDSRGSVPSQKANMIAIVIEEDGAAAAAKTNKYNHPQGKSVLVNPHEKAAVGTFHPA